MTGSFTVNRKFVARSAVLKPTGDSTLKSSSLTTNLLWYAWDTGNGHHQILQDCSPGHAMYPPTLYGASPLVGGGAAANPASTPSVSHDTTYGDFFQFSGQTPGVESGTSAGFTSFVFDTDAVRDAHNLFSQGTNAALTIGTWFIIDGAPSVDGVIFGRTARGFLEQTPYASLVFSCGTDKKLTLYYFQNGNSAATTMTSASAMSTGTLHSAFAVFKNASAGSANLTLYLDGTSIGTASSVALADTFGSENNEGQIMFGSSWHVYANHVSNVLNGRVGAGAYWTRDLSSSEITTLHNNPWTMIT